MNIVLRRFSSVATFSPSLYDESSPPVRLRMIPFFSFSGPFRKVYSWSEVLPNLLRSPLPCFSFSTPAGYFASYFGFSSLVFFDSFRDFRFKQSSFFFFPLKVTPLSSMFFDLFFEVFL